MDFASVRVLLNILPQQIFKNNIIETKTNTKSSDIELLCNYIKFINNDIDLVKVHDLLEKLQREESVRENSKVRNVIFKSLKVIFLNTNGAERLFSFDQFVCCCYNSITESLLEHKHLQLLMTLPEFKDVIRSYIPMAKLQVVLDQISSKMSALNQELVQELVEYLQIPQILREDVYEIIQKRMKHKNYKLLAYRLDDINVKDGTLSDYLKLIISIEEEKQINNIKCFVKLFPSKLSYFQEMLTPAGFKKEILFYNTFVPIVEQLGMADMDFLPRFYLVKNDMIVLNDLSVQGYSSTEETFFDYEHLSLVIRQLAKLHSMSFLIEHRLSKVLGENIYIDECFPDLTKEYHILPNELNDTHVQYAVADLEAYSYLAKHISIGEFQKRAKLKLNEVYSTVKKSDSFRNVICHGDIWKTNIFFKWYSNKQLQRSVILDYQLLKYCPQAIDILMVTYINATKQTRDQYMGLLLEQYHSELESTLGQFGIDIEQISPFKDLKKSVEELKVFGIFMGILHNKFTGLPKDKLGNILKDPAKNKQFWTDINYRIETLNSMWDEVHEEWKKKCEENVIELYELCMSM
ncbi:uncharacterized protein LOC114327345 [Diabrotica virgifera virgifera]|uniref:CHK kinase-like domain-containing protein n=1 Tax=Diabrotica virgifera virgifera TaxID=50390 RepID=A0ABM5IFP8_DIAVI|nr:uncharacterized protein LOC114327345 [Diabrotica virgifera virgifera]